MLPAARLYDDLGDDAVAHLVPGDFAAKDMEAELEGAAAATELAALEKTLAFLESHAVADGARRSAPSTREDCVICLEALDGACVYGDGACVAVPASSAVMSATGTQNSSGMAQTYVS